jgi:hypothetical protein
LRVSIRFAWYDMWVGAYYDREKGTLYVCPLPCLLLTFARELPCTEPSARTVRLVTKTGEVQHVTLRAVVQSFTEGTQAPPVPRSRLSDPEELAPSSEKTTDPMPPEHLWKPGA